MGRLASAAVASVLAALRPRRRGARGRASAERHRSVRLLRDGAFLVARLLRPRRPAQVAAPVRGRRRLRVRGARPLARQPFRPRSGGLRVRSGCLVRRPRRRARPLPDDSLAAYEYRKHGTCTGLERAIISPPCAMSATRSSSRRRCKASASARRMAPGEIRQAFIDANANLRADNIAVTCARGELIDVRICVSRDLKAFATCPQVARMSCRRDSIAVAPPR